MNILYLTDYFHPFSHGGTEQSIFHLSRSLLKKGYHITILTFNFGAKRQEVWNNLRIYRVPFYYKMSKKSPKAVSPFLLINIFSQIWFLLFTILTVIKYRIDVIHIQSSYLIIPGVIASKILRKPSIITFRDYQPLCPLGFCLTEKRDYKSCDISYFINKEISFYLKNYLNKKLIFKILFIIGVFYNRVNSFLIKKIAQLSNKKICISNKQANIFRVNGFTDLSIIYNSINKKRSIKTKKDQIVFVGRLTYGKGVHLLIDAILFVLIKYPKIKLLIIGNGFLKDYIVNKIDKYNLSRNVKLITHLDNDLVLAKISESKLSIIPATWEEPFGRVALESLAVCTPAVVTDRGGLKEIIKDKKYGFVVKANPQSLSNGIIKGLKFNNKLIRNIDRDIKQIEFKFNFKPVDNYIKLYNSL